MRCPTCGPLAIRQPGDTFCPRCGARLLPGAQEDPAPAAISDAQATLSPRITLGRTAAAEIADIVGCPRRVIADIDAPAGSLRDYQLTEVIATGGMGVVYSATQAVVGREVALKRMSPRIAGNAGDDSAFLLEAMITAKLEHPNIIPVHDLGVDGQGALFYTMRRLHGRAWSASIASMSLDENLDVLLRIGDAIAYAHAHDIIHRDIKPDNILLGDFGEVLVADWGLAIDIPTLRARRASWRTACGTPAYMAPEMAYDDHRAIGRESDVYLLGATLHEILTGVPPHPGSTVRSSVAAAAANRIDPAPPGDELGQIAARAMATMPFDRYRTVKELQQAIRDCRTHFQSETLASEADRLAANAPYQQGYRDYAGAMHAYEEALVLWSGNQRAAAGLARTRRAYAEQALGAGDLDLAASLMAVGSDDAGWGDLRTRIAASRTRRTAHATRHRHLLWLSGSLLSGLIAALTGGLILTEHERRLVVSATHDRDHAEAQLAYRESQREKDERRSWSWAPVLYENFENGVLPAEIAVLAGHWTVEHGQLSAAGPGTSLLRMRSAPGDIRLRLDVVAYHPMTLYLAVPVATTPATVDELDSLAVRFDRQCHIYRGRRELGAQDMPGIVHGVSQRIAIQREDRTVRVQINGQPLIALDAGAVMDPPDAQLIIAADAGTALEDLRIERQRGPMVVGTLLQAPGHPAPLLGHAR